MKPRKFVAAIAALVMSFGLASCMGQDDPSQLTIHGTAAKNSNGGVPTTVRIYALSSDHLFYGYDYFSLTLQGEEVLGVTLKGVLDEIYIEPGRTVTFGPYDVPRNTKRIGVVGTFKNVGAAQWRDTAPVSDRGTTEDVYIIVRGNTISIMTKAEYEAAKKQSQAAVNAAAEEKAAAETAAKKAAQDKAAAEAQAKANAQAAAQKAAEEKAQAQAAAKKAAEQRAAANEKVQSAAKSANAKDTAETATAATVESDETFAQYMARIAREEAARKAAEAAAAQ